jgi:hypothetical protein
MSESEQTLLAAIRVFSREEVRRIGNSVIARLQDITPSELFGDIRARSVWDEYCWNMQEGPFDADEWSGVVRFGSVSQRLEDMVADAAEAEVAQLQPRTLDLINIGLGSIPRPAQMLPENWEDDDILDDDPPSALLLAEVIDWIQGSAAQEDLRVIGPDRGAAVWDRIGQNARDETYIMAWLADLDTAAGFTETHVDTLADPASDLGPLIAEATEIVFERLRDLVERTPMEGFVDACRGDIHGMIHEHASYGIPKFRALVACALEP